MSVTARTKLFRHGGSQAVRIPKVLRLPQGEVTITKHGRGVLIEPAGFDAEAWMNSIGPVSDDFMAEGRNQPPPFDEKLFD